MKTKEFIKTIEDMGLFVEETTDHFVVAKEKDGKFWTAIVYKREVGVVETWGHRTNNLDRDQNEKMAKIVIEYALTPLDEREEPKRYYVKHTKLGRKSDCVNLDKSNDELIINTTAENALYQTIFTKQELIDLLGEEELERNYILEEVEA